MSGRPVLPPETGVRTLEKRGGVVGLAPARRVGNAVRGSAAKAAAGDFKMNVNSAHHEARVIVLGVPMYFNY